MEQDQVTQAAATPRVALLGDSIRMSYQARVAELLAGRAQVVGPDDNCRFALYTIERAGPWFSAFGKVDAVHWNNGLWDCGYCPYRGPSQFSVEDYLANLRTILKSIRETHAPGAKVIWATMTPQHPARAFSADAWSWRSDDIVRYNAAATDLMLSQGVQVNDLHAIVNADPDRLLGEDKLHLSPLGVDACARAVASALRLSGVVKGD
ncbi:MAG: SGNH/GDSL hydrolase family protein [Planctomycetes bacterium]|nr:SGNH/GDSL hydrolase family protein [Planctomycetota bacterium]